MLKPLPAKSGPLLKTVLIVDDHPLLREGLARLLNNEPDLKVCGEAASAHAALKAIALLKPDVVIVDITLKSGDGIELIKDMKRRSVKSLVLVLSMHEESLYAERALRAGARGYIMKEESSKNILTAIRRVLRGEVYVSGPVGAKILSSIADNMPATNAPPVERLSDRELEVFRFIGRGMGTRRIAEEMSVSVKTVESHRARIKDKLNLEDGAELAQHAMHWVEKEDLN